MAEGLPLARGRFKSLTLRFMLSATVVALILMHVDRQKLLTLLASVKDAPLALGVACMLASAMAAALVWASVFPPASAIALADAVRYTLIGFAINNVVPTGVGGDVYRVYAIGEGRYGSHGGRGASETKCDPWALAVYTVVMDRWTAFLVLLMGLALSVAMLHRQWTSSAPASTAASQAEHNLLMTCGVLATIFAVASAVLLSWRGRISFLRGAIPRELAHVAPEVAQAMRAHLASGRVVWTLVWAVASLGLEAAAIVLAGCALGASQSACVFACMAPVFRVMHRVPGFVNAVGPQESAALMLWGPFGMPAEVALSVSLLLHGMHMLVGLLGVSLYFFGPRPPESGIQ